MRRGTRERMMAGMDDDDDDDDDDDGDDDDDDDDDDDATNLDALPRCCEKYFCVSGDKSMQLRSAAIADVFSASVACVRHLSMTGAQ